MNVANAPAAALAILKRAREAPDDVLARGAFADWVDDYLGDDPAARAASELIRLQLGDFDADRARELAPAAADFLLHPRAAGERWVAGTAAPTCVSLTLERHRSARFEVRLVAGLPDYVIGRLTEIRPWDPDGPAAFYCRHYPTRRVLPYEARPGLFWHTVAELLAARNPPRAQRRYRWAAGAYGLGESLTGAQIAWSVAHLRDLKLTDTPTNNGLRWGLVPVEWVPEPADYPSVNAALDALAARVTAFTREVVAGGDPYAKDLTAVEPVHGPFFDYGNVGREVGWDEID